MSERLGKVQNPGKFALKSVALVAAVLLLSSVLWISLAGCGPKTVSFQDGAGRTITLKGTPKRLVSLSPADTETIFALGLGSQLVGVSNYCNRPEEAQKIEKVGDSFNVNLEKILSLKPDIVFCAGTPETQYVKDIENLGIPTYVSNPATVKDVLEDIKRIAKMLGVEKKGEEVVSSIQKDIDEASQWSKGQSTRPKALIVVDQDLWTVGPGSFMDDMLKLAGGDNIIQVQNQPYLQVSMEEVLKKDPDVILVTIPQDQYKVLQDKPGWSSLRAVKNGKVFFLNPDLVSRPGPSLAEGIKEMAQSLRQGVNP